MATKSDTRLHEQGLKNCEISDCNTDVKLEDSFVECGDFIISKPENPLISDRYLLQDALLENKAEDVTNFESCGFELREIETIKVDRCMKNENGLVLQKDPLSGYCNTFVNLKINEELNLQNSNSYLAGKKPNNKVGFCEVCNKTFHHYYYKYHASSHAGNTSLKCEICGKGFVRRSGLNAHIVSHSDNRPYQCNSCEKRFKTNHALHKHQYVHSVDKPFHCSQCNKSFKLPHKLKAHQHQQHVTDTRSVKKVHICSYCGKTFKSKCGLVMHINMHKGNKPFSCEICSKSFGTASSLKSHMRTHTGETPYRCKLCESAFKFSRQLSRHMKAHIENSK